MARAIEGHQQSQSRLCRSILPQGQLDHRSGTHLRRQGPPQPLHSPAVYFKKINPCLAFLRSPILDAPKRAQGRAVAQKRYLSIFLEPFRAPNPLQETSFARSWRLQTPCTAIGGLLQVQLQAQIYSYHHVTYSSTGAQPCRQLLMLVQEHSTDYA